MEPDLSSCLHLFSAPCWRITDWHMQLQHHLVLLAGLALRLTIAWYRLLAASAVGGAALYDNEDLWPPALAW
jgi:hypothetical protein